MPSAGSIVEQRVCGEHGRVVRKVLSVTELDPKAGGFDLRELFSYDVPADAFSPSSPRSGRDEDDAPWAGEASLRVGPKPS